MKVWKNRKVDVEKAKELAKKYKINMILSVLYTLRFKEEAEKYLNRSIIEEDPYILPDMYVAVDRILEAIEGNEKVIVYADYDADGATSASILIKFLKSLEVDVSYYIPNRITEGYGLNIKSLESFKKLGYTLVITVDTGIAAVEEAKFAKEIGLDLIITDHHELQEKLPEAIAVVDHKRLEKYSVENICGCMVAYKLIQAIALSIGLQEEEYTKYLPTVAIGTVADIMPLLGENRYIVQKGLEMIKNNSVNINENDKEIFKLLFKNKKISSETISYYIAPLLNAPGRLGNDNATLFLCSESKEDAEANYFNLNEDNVKRKEIVKQNISVALKIIEDEQKEKHLTNTKANNPLVVISEEFHEGVVGIVASNILDKTGRPTIVLTKTEKGYKGSRKSKRHKPI